jgi:hypothetical protein
MDLPRGFPFEESLSSLSSWDLPVKYDGKIPVLLLKGFIVLPKVNFFS